MKSIHFSFGKIIIISIITFLLIASCDVTDPKKDRPKPEGYQEDIPWPSLADSPWPRYHGNPQNTGRTNAFGPQKGVLAATISIEMGYLSSGIVVGADSSVYCTVNPGYLYSLNKYGKLNWKLKVSEYEVLNTPIIGSDGTIYIGLYQDEKFIAVRSNGSIKWEYQSNSPITEISANIGLDGMLYFVDQAGILTSLNSEGQIQWQLFVNGTRQLTFSPDGKTLYITSRYPTIIAIDLSLKRIKWEFKEAYVSSLSCDSQGNIYFIGFMPKEGKSKLFCLSKDSEVKWQYDLFGWTSYSYNDICIDKSGNIYFASDTLYSLNYFGKLRWKKHFENSFFQQPIIADAAGSIYGVLRSNDGLKMMSIKNDGTVSWTISISGIESGLTAASGGIGFDGLWYVPFDDEKSKLFILE